MKVITCAVTWVLLAVTWVYTEAIEDRDFVAEVADAMADSGDIHGVQMPTEEHTRDAILRAQDVVIARELEQMKNGARSRKRRYSKFTPTSQAIKSEAAVLTEAVRILTESHPQVKRSVVHGLILDLAQQEVQNNSSEPDISEKERERRIQAILSKFPLGPGRHSHAPGVVVPLKAAGFPKTKSYIRAFSSCYPTDIPNCNLYEMYRRIDGTCNNIWFKFWGAANIKMRRLPNLHPPTAYADVVNSPRGGNPSTLPNPRLISTKVHPDVRVASHVTNMVQQFGQFVDHDITLTPEEEQECCENPNVDPDCFPIRIPDNDIFYNNLSTPQHCLEFTRSTAFCTSPRDDHREQMNAITAFLDASQVYGSDKVINKKLRTGSNGLLNATEYPYMHGGVAGIRLLLPEVSAGSFLAGDVRVNEMPGLITMHSLFLREHNRIATEMKSLKPTWSDEKLFQETRRIVAAEFQNVVYSEYLPIVLGKDTMKKYNILLGDSHTHYIRNLDPSIFNSFATAAYRFGHSMIVSLVKMFFHNDDKGQFLLRNNYFDSDRVQQDNALGVDYILEGLSKQPAETFDRFLVEDVNNFLFQDIAAGFGSDLTARNIQRGRDHGLPGFLAFRKACGLSTNPTSGSGGDMMDIYEDVVLNIYNSPADVDLFTGGLVEKPVAGALTGPTFNCIKAEQFRRLMFGDRFFFTHGHQVGSFTYTQLKALRGRTLRDIICDNVDPTLTVPDNVFLVPPGPITKSCSTFQKLDISLFTKVKRWGYWRW